MMQITAYRSAIPVTAGPVTAGLSTWPAEQLSPSMGTGATFEGISVPEFDTRYERPAMGSGALTMASILSAFAVFWLTAGIGIGYWIGS